MQPDLLTTTPPGRLTFYFGTMNCGKSTLALQMHHNAVAADKNVALLTKLDRGGEVISSRIGLSQPAMSVADDMHVYDWYWAKAHPLDLLIVDEAQFLSPRQVDGLAHIADEAGVDVRAFGLLADFQTRLFTGSKRLIELADVREELHVSTACWCGRDGVHHARIVNGEIVREGQSVEVGDVGDGGEGATYAVLCRAHHRQGAVAPPVAPYAPTATRRPLPGSQSLRAALDAFTQPDIPTEAVSYRDLDALIPAQAATTSTP